MFKPLLNAFLLSTGISSQAFANINLIDSQNSQPETCRIAQELQQQEETAPLFEEDAETLDFMIRACDIQSGVNKVGNIVDQFEGAINDIKGDKTVLLLTPNPYPYICC